MTEQKLREKIVAILCAFYSHCDTRRLCTCFKKRGHWSLCASVRHADKILALVVKEAHYVRLAEDQSMPELAGYRTAQEELLKAGWRKVEVKDDRT